MRHLAFRLLSSTACVAIAAWTEQLPIQIYSTSDGLAHNHINCIRQDSRGFLWFCTDEGLTRFDGYQLTSYTTRDGLPHPWINDLIETRDGALWIASDGGVSRFNATRSSTTEPLFITYLPDQLPDARRVNALAEDASGTIWCATYNGLYRLDRAGDAVKFHWVDIGLPSDIGEARLVNSVALDQHSALWLGARAGLYHYLSDGTSEHYTPQNGLPDGFTGGLLQDHRGRWWVSTRTGGFCLLVADPHPTRRVVERCYSTADGLPHNDVRSIFQSSDGKMWIGTVGGLSEFNPGAASGKVFRNYSPANGLSESQIYKLAEDRVGNLWIGTRRGGVMKMASHGFVSYGEADGFHFGTSHHSIFESTRGELSVLTSTGFGGLIQRLDGKKFVAARINLPATPSGNVVLQNGFQDRTGEWWLATRDGLVHFSHAAHAENLGRISPKVYTRADGLPANSIDYVYEDSQGVIWVATTYAPLQLRQWNPKERRLRLYAAAESEFPAPNSGWVTALARDASGNLWLGFRDFGGLVVCSQGQFQRFFGTPATIRAPVNALHLDHGGRLWVASAQGGLYRIDGPGSARPRLTQYTTAEGLSSNEILCLTEDQWGRIYAGTNRGVDRLDPASGFIRRFTKADGLSKGAVALAYRDHNGELWFVSDEGISRLMPTFDPAPAPPTILITAVRSMGVPSAVSALGEARVENVRTPPNHNHVQIDFVGVDFRPGAALRYQYKLENVDPDWSAPTSERTVNYAGISPGSYRFLVRAVSLDGIASTKPAALTFRVLTPVWRQWWFIALCAGAASILVYAAHRFRVRQLLAVESIRMRIATDLHDDIGASLSNIAVLSEVADAEVTRLGLSAGQHLRAPLSRIGEVSRELIDSMSDIVWAISPHKDRLRNLTQRMREFGGEVLGSRGVQFSLQAAGLDQEKKLDPEVRRQTFLIFKECINNILRHSMSTRVKCDFGIQRGQLVLRVSDNGLGFATPVAEGGRAVLNAPGPPNRPPGPHWDGQGLLSMQRRAAALGGKIDIAAEDGQGVTVVLHVPIT